MLESDQEIDRQNNYLINNQVIIARYDTGREQKCA